MELSRELEEFADQAANKGLDGISEQNRLRLSGMVRQKILDVKTGATTRAQIASYFTKSETTYIPDSKTGFSMPTDNYFDLVWGILQRNGFHDEPGFSQTLPTEIDEDGRKISTIVHTNVHDQSLQLVETNSINPQDPENETTSLTLYSDSDTGFKDDSGDGEDNDEQTNLSFFDPEYYQELEARIDLAMKSNGKVIFLYDDDPRRTGTYITRLGETKLSTQPKMVKTGDKLLSDYDYSKTPDAGPYNDTLDWPKEYNPKLKHGFSFHLPKRQTHLPLETINTWHTTNKDGLLFVFKQFTVELNGQFFNVTAHYAQKGPSKS